MRRMYGRLLRRLGLVGLIAIGTALLGQQTGYLRGGDESRSTMEFGGEGEGLVMVFIGSATCASSGSEQVRTDVAEASRILRARAVRTGVGFRRVGVAESDSPERGVAFLGKVGEFDEIIAGGGWTSTGMMKYVVEGFPGPGVTPQIVVFRRSLGVEGWGIDEESLLVRLAGADEIGEWIDKGGPLER